MDNGSAKPSTSRHATNAIPIAECMSAFSRASDASLAQGPCQAAFDDPRIKVSLVLHMSAYL